MRTNQLLSAVLVVCLVSLAGCAELRSLASDTGVPILDTAVTHLTQAADALLPITSEEEATIGQAIALQIVSRYGGVVQTPGLVRYVNLVGRAVANTCDRPGLAYHFAVLNHPSLNAFAAPGGYVFVTRGLLDAMQNEAELAAVLGHEIAHISRAHMVDVIQRAKRINGLTQTGLSLLKNNPALFKNLIDHVTKKILDEGLDQDKELEADTVGEVFAARVGYDPAAYLALLARLRELKGDDRAFFKSHPNFSTRIEAVERTMAREGLKSTATVIRERFRASTQPG
jgi:predicted Zn-dependent protease